MGRDKGTPKKYAAETVRYSLKPESKHFVIDEEDKRDAIRNALPGDKITVVTSNQYGTKTLLMKGQVKQNKRGMFTGKHTEVIHSGDDEVNDFSEGGKSRRRKSRKSRKSRKNKKTRKSLYNWL